MRIAVLVEFYPPKLGSDRRIYELMTRLPKNYEIHFLVLPPFRMLANQLSLPQSKYHFHYNDNMLVQGKVRVHFLPISHSILKLWKKSYTITYVLTMLLVFFKLVMKIKKINPAVIILNNPSVYTGFLGFLAGKILRKFLICDFNDLIAHYTIKLLGLNPGSVAAKLCIYIQNFIVKNCNKIIAPTIYIVKYASSLSLGNDKIVLIPNGADTKFFDPEKFGSEELKFKLNLSKKKICVYCGRLDDWAGVNLISQLCKVFCDKDPNVHFVVAGTGTEEKNFVFRNTISLGEVPFENVPEVLAVADIVLVPFPNDEVSHAASPLKLFEGMAMGKAVVASDVSGISEVITNQKNGILVNPENVNEWIKAIEQLIRNESSAKQIGENARRTIKEKYDWELLSKRMEKILKMIYLEKTFGRKNSKSRTRGK